MTTSLLDIYSFTFYLSLAIEICQRELFSVMKKLSTDINSPSNSLVAVADQLMKWFKIILELPSSRGTAFNQKPVQKNMFHLKEDALAKLNLNGNSNLNQKYHLSLDKDKQLEALTKFLSSPLGLIKSKKRFLNRLSQATALKTDTAAKLFLETEHLVKASSLEYNVGEQHFFCTENTFNLLRIPQDKSITGFLSFLPFIIAEDRDTLKNNWNQALNFGLEFNQLTRLAGSTKNVWLKFKIKPICDDVKVIKIIGTIQDVTEYIEHETQLQADKIKAEQALQVKSEFISLMSHEIRTPLNAIMGLTYLLLQEEDVAAAHKEHLQSINFSSQNLLSLVNKTLDFSRIEAGKIELEKVNFQLKELLKDIHRSLYVRANEKQLALELAIDPNTPEEVAGDPSRLTQILNNLISNAIKFTESGSVKLSVNVVYYSNQDWVMEFSVADTGIGIPAEQQQLIFESFVQANVSTHRQYGGTGLGLAITKKIVELHKGSIHIESEPGKGSVFTVRLRYAKPQPTLVTLQKADAVKIKESKLRDVKVLVIDDNIFNKMVASKLLASWQAEVDTAEDGFTALEKIKSAPYDIILMDLHMPGMNGFEAITAIRNLGLQVPIIALTANNSEEEKNRILALGGNDYLTKPFVPKELYNKLAHHLHFAEII